ncbi:LysM peptidoglycan-binding domain-containing protein [Dysgonomonas sp. ZJ279]|uniref:LysM peptidoglycan-binding domain-containing protein n=1 Tax=Dysgonomonas sp. ZJ279 TaxID=2709796 RepID=UPI0013EC2D4F|nr:LysM peptidoglycan-binding domain-containing protein [Dysgonomonas sp. ZJ279]
MGQFKKILSIYILLSFFCLYTTVLWASNPDEKKESKNVYIANQGLLDGVFNKLYNLEKNKSGKVNIVHIGDSHIQADIFTNTIRESLQQIFGNGGYGFTFPYSLLRTNGTRSVRYISDATWKSLLNVYPVADVGIGLSGIALYTSSSEFVVQLTAEEKYKFNTVKIIYPSEEPNFKMSVSAELAEVAATPTMVTAEGAMKSHTIKKGESLSAISRKYGVTVAQIKKTNNMKSDMIHPGKSLKIPTKGTRVAVPTKKLKVEDDVEFVMLKTQPFCSSYTSDSLMDRIMILPDGQQTMYNLNGFVIENNEPGIIYHTIGVNGAKMSDYNKYPLFFKQLPLLAPDLIILSFGTNESFGRLSVTEYMYQLKEFVANIKKLNINATILVMTPPPSMFRRRRPNSFVTNYSVALMGLNDMPIWDLYTRMGGLSGIKPKGEYSGLIARDNVHYTSKGYQVQGEMFSSDFIKAYNNFKETKKN